MTEREKLDKLVSFIDAKKAHNIVALDLCGATVIADYFVICTAGSPAQMSAIYNAACEEMEKIGCPAEKSEGMKNPDWVLVDFGGIMLHIFSAKMRDFYGLDNLWADAVRLETNTIDEY